MNHYEQRQADRRARMLARAAKMRTEGEAKEAAGRKALEAIPFGQPILVGHHSERGDRAYRGRAVGNIDRGYAMQDAAADLETRAENIGSGGVSSDDPDAIVKLQAQVDTLKSRQDLYKKINKAHAAFVKNPASIDASDLSDAHKEMIRTYVPTYSWIKHPIAPYQITNNGANIRRLEKRIADLAKFRTAPTTGEIKGDGWRVVDDREENRIMFYFDAIPSEEVRTLMRSRAFLWSPSRKAWVRKITGNAMFAANQIITKLKTMTICAPSL